MYPHRIRLRGPWEYQPLARAMSQRDGRVEMVEQSLPPPGKMTMPGRWSEGGLHDFAGRVRFRRRFGLPRQIDGHERVWLTFAGAEAIAEVWLNGQYLGRHEGAQEPFEFEITPLLRERNELLVLVEGPAGAGGLWGEVALEVRCLAFLRSVRLWSTFRGENANLHISGEVVGTCERPLELYVILDRSTVAYTTVEASASGQSFNVVSGELPPERWRNQEEGSSWPHNARVELVDGATLWYAFEQPFEFREEENKP
jgi:Glycosyl hydrolases family 2, sugar binding domain